MKKMPLKEYMKNIESILKVLGMNPNEEISQLQKGYKYVQI